MKVSKRVEKYIDVELDDAAALALRWVFKSSNNGRYPDVLAPLAKALGVGDNE